ncbi:hypothetical protein [Aneurinibacillus tyrosinisolvens]|uniref:hypothetical protein n=1 Tax=Aneurinibacillus tyrosinisolvens TaxID=1443435 RepID=UPI00063F3495|nr:hypothetical protein [Aneurinibacillus tyrosinisolvens]
MNYIEGPFTPLNGGAKIAADDDKLINLTIGEAVKLLHPEHGWLPGIYQGNSRVIIPQGTYELHPGDRVRAQE